MVTALLIASTASEQTGGVMFVGGIILALASFITGICLACSRRKNKWLEAAVIGLGLPFVFGGMALAGCGMAFKGL